MAPVYLSRSGEIVSGDDRCPLPRSERRVGHEVETMALACRVAAESDHLVYGPAPVAAAMVAQGALVELEVPELVRRDAVHVALDEGALREEDAAWLVAMVRGVFGPTRLSGVVPALPSPRHDGRAAG